MMRRWLAALRGWWRRNVVADDETSELLDRWDREDRLRRGRLP